MSIQSDVEMLSIQAMEAYAINNHISGEEAMDIFHKYQVFEKILLQHSYDAVIGPVADDNTMETVQLYISGILTGKEAVERLRYNKVNNQVSFHSNEAIKCLKLIRRERYE